MATSETNEGASRSRSELIHTAALSALKHVIEPTLRLSDRDIQDAYGRGLLPDGIDAEIAVDVNAGLHEGMGRTLTPEQSKWFALGAAAQAGATAELRELGVEQ